MSLSIDVPEYEFTSDYVSLHLDDWGRLISPLRDTPLVAIEIGSLEGRSALWWLDNLCTHPASKLYCIDPAIDPLCFRRLRKNLALHPRGSQVKVIQELSRVALSRLPEAMADFIYVDGSHEARDVLLDGLLALHLAKPGGLLVFDDYLWDDPDSTCVLPPKPGLDAFLTVAADVMTVVHSGYQLVVRKL